MDAALSDSLERFVRAQEARYPGVVAELRVGRKTGHWIWYIFPQLRGLGSSQASVYYGIADADEARRYIEHPILGPRYEECVALVHHWIVAEGYPAIEVMGSEIDVMKLRSSLQLFGALTSSAGLKSMAAELSQALKCDHGPM
ncbi:MAG: DUF1810 domain-containing protein [Bacteroidota bacterium]